MDLYTALAIDLGPLGDALTTIAVITGAALSATLGTQIVAAFGRK